MDLGTFGNTYLSVFSHIETQLTNDGLIVSGNDYGVTLMDSYPTDEDLKRIVLRHNASGSVEEIILPVVTIEQGQINTIDFELGSSKHQGEFKIIITVFAETNLQREQITYSIYNAMTNHVNYYNYDVNFETPPVSGTLYVSDIKIYPTTFVGSANPAIRYGADIMFNVSKLIE